MINFPICLSMNVVWPSLIEQELINSDASMVEITTAMPMTALTSWTTKPTLGSLISIGGHEIILVRDSENKLLTILVDIESSHIYRLGWVFRPDSDVWWCCYENWASANERPIEVAWVWVSHSWRPHYLCLTYQEAEKEYIGDKNTTV